MAVRNKPPGFIITTIDPERDRPYCKVMGRRATLLIHAWTLPRPAWVLLAMQIVAGIAGSAGPPTDCIPLDSLLRGLGSDDAAIRDDCTHRLMRRIDALPNLRNLAKAKDAEVRHRAARLVSALEKLVVFQNVGRAKRHFEAGEPDQAIELLVRWGGEDTDQRFVPVLRDYLDGRIAEAERTLGRQPLRLDAKTWLKQAGQPRRGPPRVVVHRRELACEEIRREIVLAPGVKITDMISRSIALSSGPFRVTKMGGTGPIHNNAILLSDGDVECFDVGNSVIITPGSVEIRGGCFSSVIIAGGGVTISGDCSRSTIRSAGRITCRWGAIGIFISGGEVDLQSVGDQKPTVRQNDPAPLGKTRFFTLARVGLSVGEKGTKIGLVEKKGIAAASGLIPGDEIRSVNGVKVADAAALRHALLRAYAFEESAVLGVARGGKPVSVTIPVRGR